MRVLTIQKAYALAVEHHQAGRLGEAESLYRQILSYQADHPEALHRMGLLNQQAGRGPDALQWLRRASVVRPKDPVVQNDLGTVLAALGRASEALGAYRQAIAMRPDFPEAHNNIGNALAESGRYEEAAWAYRRALARRPGYAEAHFNLGNALRQLNRLDEAVAAFRQAVALKPDNADAHNNLGLALQDQSDLPGAIAAFQQATAARPNFPEAFNNLADVLRAKGDLDDAAAACRQALSLRPAYARAYNTLGQIEHARSQLDEAITAYRQALSLRQNFPEAYNNLGLALRDRGDIDQAIATFQQGIALQPTFAAAQANLARALRQAGRLEQAVESYRTVLELRDDAELADELLYAVHFDPDYDPARIYEEHIRWNHVYARPLAPVDASYPNDRDPNRRLRVAYVLPALDARCLGRFLLPLLAQHHRQEVEVFCYADGTESDPASEKLKLFADSWLATAGVPDDELAQQIREDRIDILIDLALHSPGNRMLVFAQKPAPVQGTYLAYPGTSGLDTMDWRITDPYLDPPGEGDAFYSEELIRLPSTWLCYQPPVGSPEIGLLPAMNRGHLTFGGLGHLADIPDQVLKTWCSVLEQVPSSRIVLAASRPGHRRRVYEQFAARGIEAQRAEFIDSGPIADTPDRFGEIDIALDPCPFSDAVGICDALWAGVPVVSVAGRSAVSRMGLSTLANIGLPDLVAHSREEYVRIAAELSSDLVRLADLRAQLRGRMEHSPLLNAAQFARDFESALRTIWRQWCEA